MAEKDTLSQDFEKLQDKVTNLFHPIYDKLDEFFIELVGKFQKAGVDFLEINNFKKTAIAKHMNFYEYPERRYAIVVNDKNKVKFYELEFKSADIDGNAKEISQKEFEDLTIPTYLKPNPLMAKKDAEEDKDPTKAQEAQFGKDPTKEKKDKDALSQEEPSEKKVIEYGETSSPKKIEESIEGNTKKLVNFSVEISLEPGGDITKVTDMIHSAIIEVPGVENCLVDIQEVAPPGWEGTVKAMKKNKDITNPWALAWSMKNKGFKSHKKEGLEEGDKYSRCPDCGKQTLNSTAKIEGKPANYCEECGYLAFAGKKQIKKETTERPVTNQMDTVGYTGNVGNLGPLEGKEDKKCRQCGGKLDKDGVCVGCHYEDYGAEKDDKSGVSEATKYQVKFLTKENKEENIIIEAVDVKDAAIKVYKLGAQSILSADRYEKGKASK